MRVDYAVLAFTLLTSAAAGVIEPRHIVRIDAGPVADADEHDLYKRRGGGGGGSRGGSGGSSGGSGGKSGGGKSSGGSGGTKGSSKPGSSGSGGGSSGSSGNRGSNTGGTSSKGTGPKPGYGGGRYYGGGARTPYRSGGRSPGGILPFVLIGGALAFWPGVWLYGAYMYHYPNDYHYHNATTNKNESRPVICGCAQYSVCGCDDNNNTAYYNDLIGDGTYSKLNKSVVNVANVNGTETILINGTLPNDTTAATDDTDSAASSGLQALAEALGFWPAIAAVAATVFLV
ncbi:hypothetical protein G7046_g5652 [Stylonectria norvegica]|nr:hypothetical protein G7046_g5652 [Stylonectria norvegica]